LAQTDKHSNTLCSQLGAIDPQLVHTLLDALLSYPPSPSMWPFIAAFSAHCRVVVPSAVRDAYSAVLRKTASRFFGNNMIAAGQALLASLGKAGLDLDCRDARGDTLFLDRANSSGTAMLTRTLMDLGATLWVSNSRNQQTVLHRWMGQKRFDIVHHILLEKAPWDGVVFRLDWWAPDGQGRTPLQTAQAALKTMRSFPQGHDYGEVKATGAVVELIPVLLQH
jgi:hypothetical protein